MRLGFKVACELLATVACLITENFMVQLKLMENVDKIISIASYMNML